MRIAVAFELDGEPGVAACAAAAARVLAPAASVIAICASGCSGRSGQSIAQIKTQVARLGLTRAAVVCHPALADAGARARGAVLAALARHLEAEVVLFGVPAAEDISGLAPAAVAQALAAPGIFRARDVAADPANAGALLVTVRLGGQVRRLRVRPPAVLSLLAAEAPTAASAGGAAAASELVSYDLAQIGLDPRTLPDDVDSAATFAPLTRKPSVLSDLGALIRR